MLKSLVLSKSLKPYLVLFCLNVALLVAAIVLNSGVIGALFGSAAAYLDPRYNLVFVLGSCLIYALRRPMLSIACVVLFAVSYQVYLIEISGVWEMRGLAEPSYFNSARIYAGTLVLSVLGFLEFIIISAKQKFGISKNANG